MQLIIFIIDYIVELKVLNFIKIYKISELIIDQEIISVIQKFKATKKSERKESSS